jgi:drug/metabolite transporter (DMT)-like permease
MPVLTMLLSYLLLGEALTATQLIGMAVAVAGVHISARG